MGNPLLVAIVGATASGKTELSIRLAGHVPVTIVSADSRQVYRYLDIGTAKPTVEQRRAVPHRCIDIVDPSEEYSAGRYGTEATHAVREILAEGRMPLVVGGSGLYVRAVVSGLATLPEKDDELRRLLEKKLHEEGEDALRKELEAIDPATAHGIEHGKPRRLIRALEVFHLTGRPLSEHLHTSSVDQPFRPLVFGLEVPRDELYGRIDLRALRMMTEGLMREVQDVLDRGVPRTAQALNTVGYKEALQCIDGKVTESRMIELIQQSTRRFAKRQRTWFRGEKDIRWIDAQGSRSVDMIVDEILSEVEQERKK